MKDLNSLMKNRRSIRTFTNEPIPVDVTNKVISAAYFAPSAARRYGFQIIVVEDSILKDQIKTVCEQGERTWVHSRPNAVKDSILQLPGFSFQKSFLSEATILLIISTNPNNPKIPYPIESCWLAIAYMILEIENSGLGTLTYTPSICLTNRRLELNKVLEIPQDEHIQVILPVGYYSEKPEHEETHIERNVHNNTYGTPYFK